MLLSVFLAGAGCSASFFVSVICRFLFEMLGNPFYRDLAVGISASSCGLVFYLFSLKDQSLGLWQAIALSLIPLVFGAWGWSSL